MSGIELSADFNRSLGEVVRWCSLRSLGKEHIDPVALSHRRAKLEMAGRLFDEARKIPSAGLRALKSQETKQWKSAILLLEEVRTSLGSLENTLRSAALVPPELPDDSGDISWWAETVSEVVAKRSQLLAQSPSSDDLIDAESGRLLLYFPVENLADGAAELASNGFFNSYNVPPWDIWVGFADLALISWVPPVFIEAAAQMGIDANPEVCIRWADES